MRALQEHDFDQLATRVVDGFMGGEKLADAAATAAMDHELAPDQIERLVESANTTAFLRLMEQQRTSANGNGPDMTREFDPIDARQIIEAIMGRIQVPGADGLAHAEPDGDTGPLPDEVGEAEALSARGAPAATAPKDSPIDDNNGPFPKGDKQKAKEKAVDQPPKKPAARAPDKDEAKEAVFRRLRVDKLAGILEDQLRQAELAFGDASSRLDHVMRLAHGAPTMAAFEKDALALHDDEVGIAVLNGIRGSRGLGPLSPSEARQKYAALADRHVVEESRATREFDTLVKIAREAHRLHAGIEHLRAQCI